MAVVSVTIAENSFIKRQLVSRTVIMHKTESKKKIEQRGFLTMFTISLSDVSNKVLLTVGNRRSGVNTNVKRC